MVYLYNNQVALSPTAQLDAFGRLRVSQPQTLFDSQQRFGLDRSFVSNTSPTGASISFISTQSSANLQVQGSVSGAYAARESRYVFKYQPGKSQLAMMTFVMAPRSSGNLRQQVGYFGSDNGYFLQLSDNLYICERSNSFGTIQHSNIAQTAWNGDKLNGSGASGINLDITKAQIFFTDMEWLGVGSVRCGFVIDGQFIIAHTFKHANLVSAAYITTACLPVRYEITTLTASAPATSNLTQICCTVASEAGYTEPFSVFSTQTALPTGYTGWNPVLSARLAPGRLEAITLIEHVELALSGTGTIQWALWSQSNVSATFSSPPQTGSVQIATGGTMNVASSWQIASGLAINGTGSSTSVTPVNLENYFSQIGRDSFSQTSDVMTLAVYPITGTPAGTALLSWQELL